MNNIIIKKLNSLGVQKPNQTKEQIERLANLCIEIAKLVNEYELDSYIDIDDISELDDIINEYRGVLGW